MGEVKAHYADDATPKVYCWQYDDGSVASLKFDGGSKKSCELKSFPNALKMQDFYSASGSRKKKQVKLKKRKLHGGIDGDKDRVIFGANRDTAAMREGFAELEKMTAGHTLNGQNEAVMNLLSLAMAGYISRLLISKMDKSCLYFYRAPIVHVIGHKKDAYAGFEYLERIIESLSVDTSRDGKLVMHNPPVIPQKRPVEEITDCAYLVMKRDKQKKHCETQYRDTVVLIHPHFFEDSQWKNFVKRNVWASIFVFNEKPDKSGDTIQRVDMNDLALPEWNWDVEKLNGLIKGYVDWLSYIQYSADYKKRWRFWNIVGEQMLYYSELQGAAKGKRRLQGSEREHKILQIESLFAFLDFCTLTNIISSDRRSELMHEWMGGLFPGYNLPPTNLKKEESQYKKELEENARLLKEFKQLIKCILEKDNSRFVRFVPDGEPCAKSDVMDIVNGPWAYLYWKEPKKIQGKPKADPFRAVKIRRKELVALGKHFNLLDGGQEIGAVKSKINNNETKNNYTPEEIGFIFRFMTERFKFEEITEEASKKPLEGVILHLDKLTFLKPETLKKLQEQFPPNP